MASSYRKIDYRLRPAKAVERRMIAEYFLRLRTFGPVENYQYIGMGSVYFSDFALFHNVCGFNSMVSIEGTEDPTIKKRFNFNSPLGTIELKFGHSSKVLPKLDWTGKRAVWLDYDGSLESSVLTDVSFLCSKLTPESMLLVSVNAELVDEEDGNRGKLDVLRQRIGESKIPALLQSSKTVAAKEIPALYQEIFDNEIKDALAARNSGKAVDQKLAYRQVLYFRYADGAEMLTLGWVFFLEKDAKQFEHCAFSQLTHARSGKEPFFIDIPLMTNAEMRELNRCPVVDGKIDTRHVPLPPTEIKKYFALKRFWPVLQIPEMT